MSMKNRNTQLVRNILRRKVRTLDYGRVNFHNNFRVAGPTTLSTSTSSYEPPETHDPNLNRLAVDMFSKVSKYLTAELGSSESEYGLLEEMNKVTSAKYKDLKLIAANVSKGLTELNEKCKSYYPKEYSIRSLTLDYSTVEVLRGYLDQIDQIEDSVGKLEHAAFALDAYTIRLENKFKSLEKR